MAQSNSPLGIIRQRLAGGAASAWSLTAEALARANSNAGRNVYLALDAERVLAEASALDERFPDPARRPPLFGVPVSLKDCLNMEGYPTTCGSPFYAERNGIAAEDSNVAAVLREQGAVIVGKTHLHPLTYGITGENPDYGDCLQPADATRLTGGSTSGGAASVQEGSAVAAIGTDTGGSIRAPAALCGLAGYRGTVGLSLRMRVRKPAAPGEVREPRPGSRNPWKGAMHLAPSFDTLGWLFRDLRDGPALATALFDLKPIAAESAARVKIGVVGAPFLDDCEPGVLEVYEFWKQRLAEAGATLHPVDVGFWTRMQDGGHDGRQEGGPNWDPFNIFAGIQAHEASVLHRGYFEQFPAEIAERLTWGASLTEPVVEGLRDRHRTFRVEMGRLMGDYDFLIAPCTPVSELVAGTDQSGARRRILRYTCPMSLAGTPVVTLPGATGGVQLTAHRGADVRLLAFAAYLGERLADGGVTLLP